MPTSAWGSGLFLDANLFYASDSGKVASTDTDTKTFMDFAVGFAVDKKGQFQVGWNYSILSTNRKDTDTTAYAATEMGPKFVYFLDRDRTWSTSFTYNLIVNATYKTDADGEKKWRGTSMRFDFGYSLPVSEGSRLGLHFVYNATAFNEEVTDSTLEKVSYTRTFMYPAIHYSIVF